MWEKYPEEFGDISGEEEEEEEELLKKEDEEELLKKKVGEEEVPNLVLCWELPTRGWDLLY